MALQFHRLISTSCFHKNFNNSSGISPAMLCFRALPNFPCSCSSKISNGFSTRSGREVHIRTSKFLHGVCINKYNTSFFFEKYRSNNSLCSSNQDCSFCSVVTGGNVHIPKFVANELQFRRSFSTSRNNCQAFVKDNGVAKDVIEAKKGSASQMLLGKKKKKKKNKPLAVIDGVSEQLNTDVINHPVTRSLKAVQGKTNVLQDGLAKKSSTKGSGKVIKKLKKMPKNKKKVLTPTLQPAKNKNTNASTEVIKVGNQQLRPLYPPLGKSVVVVESVTKARVIQNYLGTDYEVLASYGHVRDLARKSGSVRPNDDFSLVWEVPSSAWTHLKSIKIALNSTDNLILATDPDREGEAIAWHIIEMLQQQDALNENIKVVRVVFHEITESSIKSALQAPREIDSNLVNAYLARRALDYLIGFSISPLLWRKLPGCQSAGRVQSAALALICDRETEIEQFNPQEYWTLEAEFSCTSADTLGRYTVPSHLTHFNSKKIERLSISSREDAEAMEEKVNNSLFEVKDVKTSKVKRNPPTPYITSSLQQDSANKLHFTAAYTMKLAQQLYEGIKLSDNEATGLITYMRTDGMHISTEAAEDINSFVAERYGKKFASEGVRKYFKKVKNAQEAHEAIRPTSIRRLPSTLAGILDEDTLKLYTLIWSKTMACQMEPASIDMIQVNIGNKDGDIVLRSVGSRISFSGYEEVYKDKEAGIDVCHVKDGDSNDAAFAVLHELKGKDSLSLVKVDLGQHYTKPPSRYSEGALVKNLEELGIGRPSTYASIMKVLQDRRYVTIKNRILHPEFRGRMVSEFLSHHFSEVANYSFTADMETELDNVSAGMTEWKGLLGDYWSRFHEYCKLASNANIHQVEKMLEEKFGHILFSSLPSDSRLCPSCGEGTLRFKVSKFGSGYFIGCDQHPRCKFIAGTVFNDDEETVESPERIDSFPPRLLGHNPISNEKIFLKKGPYGYYVQVGEDRTGSAPKRSSVTENIDSVTLEGAIELLQYPITLGNHPEDGHPVFLNHSRIGFSIKHRRTASPVPKSMNAKEITLEDGLKLLQSANARRCGRPKGKPNRSRDDEEDGVLFG